MELNPMQRTAVITAMQKALKKEGDASRKEADDAILRLFDETGTDRVRVSLGDAEVGTFSLTFDKDGYEVTDKEAFDDFCIANGLAHESVSIKPEWMSKAAEELAVHYPDGVVASVVLDSDAPKLFKRIDDSTFVIDGTNEVIPGIKPTPKTVKGTQLRGCKPEDVIPAMKGLGVGVEQLLLGDAS